MTRWSDHYVANSGFLDKIYSIHYIYSNIV